MRLQQPIFVDKPVASIKLRIKAVDVPTSARVDITDIQLQAGEQATGVVPNPSEVGSSQLGSQYRNGVVGPGLEVIGMSNTDKATPVRMHVKNASGETRIGSYRFGDLDGDALVDPVNFTATHGYGRPPIITERQDLYLKTNISNRLHLQLAWNGRE